MADLDHVSSSDQSVPVRAMQWGLMDALAVGVLLLSPDGRVVEGNGESDRLIGVPWQRIVEPGLVSFVDTDGTPLRDDELPGSEALRTGAAVDGRIVGVCRTDGSVVWLRNSARPLRAADGSLQLVVVTFVDVTEDRSARLRLDSAQEVVDRILTSIGDQIFSGEVQPDGTHRPTYAGPGAEKLVGLPDPSATLPTGIWERLLHPDDLDRYEASLRTFEGGEDSCVEYRVVGFDGVTRWIRERVWPHRTPEGLMAFDGVVSDITDDRTARDELAEANETMQRILRMIDEYVFTGELRPDGTFRHLFEGPGLDEILGGRLPPAVERGAVWTSCVHPDDRDVHAGHLAAIAAGVRSAVEYRLVGLDGVTRWIHDRTWPRRPGPDGTQVFDGAVTDVTIRREAIAALEQAGAEADRLSRTDDLTQAYNRRHAVDRLVEELGRWAAGAPAPGVLLVDIDHFKRLNDTYGHAAGDAVLREFARRLTEQGREDDAVARWGGEEFVVLMPGGGDPIGLGAAAERVRQAICATPFTIGGRSVRVRASVGAAGAAPGRHDVDLVLEAADDALYAAKRAGRNRIRIADPASAGVTAPNGSTSRTA